MPHKFIISGGGTGGHIFPAVAVANELKFRFPDCEILFVGANGRMEMEKVPLEGYKIIGLDVSGLKRSVSIKNLKVVWQFVSSFFKARKILRDFRPDCMLGTGGYASLAVLFAGSQMGFPSVIWEGNGYAGLTNRILAKRVSVICTGLPGMDKFFPPERIVQTGNPVRREIVDLPSRKQGLDYFNLDRDKKVIFITGGSLGARTINESIDQGLKHLTSQHIQIIWQTGKNYMPQNQSGAGVHIVPFLKEMNLAYAAADLVISRAGALSIAEIAVAGKACLLIPSPNVTDDHQTQNALKLVSHNAAILIKDSEAKEMLVPVIIETLNNDTGLEEMRNQVKSLANPMSAQLIADEMVKLCKN